MAQCIVTTETGLALSTALDGCASLVLDSTEYASFMLFHSSPQPNDIGTAFVWGFSLVVGSYLFGWAAGAVLNFLKRN